MLKNAQRDIRKSPLEKGLKFDKIPAASILCNPLLRGVSRSDGVCMKQRKIYHYTLKLKGRPRLREMEGLGIQFIRFNDLDVKRNMMGILSAAVAQWIEGHTPDPSQEGNWD